jgi:glutathionylspermidine synthase
MRKQTINPIPEHLYSQLGWDFLISEEIGEYIINELILVTETERDAYYNAANELYELFCAAAEHVIQHNLFDKLDIPKNLIELIKITWEDDRHLHLFGRFDFAGGVDGLPIKVMEFNADTPSSLPETAIIQWAQAKANNLNEENQFNFVYDSLIDNFVRLRDENADLIPRLLVSTMSNAPEDDANVSVICEAAREAGFEVFFNYMEDVTFSENEGIFAKIEERYERCDFWFKLVPWEYIGQEEPELASLLTTIVKKRLAIVINPAYTLLFQSKGILKYLWDLYPNHPLLLATFFEKPKHSSGFVKKAMLGREGANVSIYNSNGETEEATTGEYGEQKMVYQNLAKLNSDDFPYFYQAGVFFAWEGCGLGFRRNASKIIDNAAHFLGHYIANEEVKKSRLKFW